MKEYNENGITFKAIEGFDTFFAATDGHIYRRLEGVFKVRTESLRKDIKNHYYICSMVNGSGKWVNRYVHSLICSTFYKKPKGGSVVVCHKDGNPHNNRPENLVWSTHRRNAAHRYLHNTQDDGVNNSRACLSAEDLLVCRYLLKNTGFTREEIGEVCGVSKGTVGKIASNIRYKNTVVEAVTRPPLGKIMKALDAGALLKESEDETKIYNLEEEFRVC